MNANAASVVVVLLVASLVAVPAGAAGTAAPGATTGAADAGGAAAATSHCSFPVSFVDASGVEVTVREEPERVVTLAPSAAQTMWEIGAREKVVGLTKYASYLEGAASRTNVSGAQQIVVIEKVVALNPDLVIAPNVIPNETVGKLRDAGLTVYRFEKATSIEDIYAKTERIGRLVGACDGAAETVDWMRDRIRTVREAVEGRERPDVLYVFYGFTAGEGTFVHEVIETAGGNNVAAEVGIEGYRRISREVVVRENPDWIVLNDQDPGVPETKAFNVTRAVRKDQVVVVRIEHLNQPAPRVVHAITKLASAFHPEAYARANATATPTSTAAPTATPSAGTTTEAAGTTVAATASATPETTATPGQPGFGALGALAALAGALLAARRARV